MAGHCSYFERSRTHLSLDKDTPIPRPVMFVLRHNAIGRPRSGWTSPFMSDRYGAPRGSIRSRRSVTIDEPDRRVELSRCLAAQFGAGTSGPPHPSYGAHDIAQRRRGGTWGGAQ
jgi:hypothetical protein